MRSPSSLLAIVVMVGGCNMTELDNYDPPKSTITGRVVYQGQPVGVRSNGVQLELWQSGYALNQKVPVYVDQDGSFSITVFNGAYMLTRLAGNGPWVDQRDTINIDLRGNATIDVPVEPYYAITNATVSPASGALQAAFNVASVNTTRALEYVGLYVATTMFVDRTNMSVRSERARSAIPDLAAPITLSIALPEALAQREYVFARIGVKTVGVAEMLFGPIVKISL
jgi:uncharacterized protein DUF3823